MFQGTLGTGRAGPNHVSNLDVAPKRFMNVWLTGRAGPKRISNLDVACTWLTGRAGPNHVSNLDVAPKRCMNTWLVAPERITNMWLTGRAGPERISNLDVAPKRFMPMVDGPRWAKTVGRLGPCHGVSRGTSDNVNHRGA